MKGVTSCLAMARNFSFSSSASCEYLRRGIAIGVVSADRSRVIWSLCSFFPLARARASKCRAIQLSSSTRRTISPRCARPAHLPRSFVPCTTHTLVPSGQGLTTGVGGAADSATLEGIAMTRRNCAPAIVAMSSLFFRRRIHRW